jgi:hypothetical protein
LTRVSLASKMGLVKEATMLASTRDAGLDVR